MRHIILCTLALGLGLAPLSAHADPAPAVAASVAAGSGSASQRILGALDLPLQAQALRKAGTEEKDIKAGLKAARDKKLDARATAELFSEVAKASTDHGPIGNFGAFVTIQLEAGLRGKDLAAAIRQEHATRGKGKSGERARPDSVGGPDDRGKPEGIGGPDDKGKPEGVGRPDDRGKPEGAGKPEDAGRPDAAGRPDDRGKPEVAGKPEDAGKPGGATDKALPADKGKAKAAGKDR